MPYHTGMVIADIETDLVDYADFEEVGSVARARSFITAAKRWLILRADSASNQSSSLTLGKGFVESMLKRAQDYVAANATGPGGGRGGVRFLGVGSSFR
jgi:hypothetical protein